MRIRIVYGIVVGVDICGDCGVHKYGNVYIRIGVVGCAVVNTVVAGVICCGVGVRSRIVRVGDGGGNGCSVGVGSIIAVVVVV